MKMSETTVQEKNGVEMQLIAFANKKKLLEDELALLGLSKENFVAAHQSVIVPKQEETQEKKEETQEKKEEKKEETQEKKEETQEKKEEKKEEMKTKENSEFEKEKKDMIEGFEAQKAQMEKKFAEEKAALLEKFQNEKIKKSYKVTLKRANKTTLFVHFGSVEVKNKFIAKVKECDAFIRGASEPPYVTIEEEANHLFETENVNWT